MEKDFYYTFQIFFPNIIESLERAKKSKQKFVHYTSASSASEILKNKEIWLRHTDCLNDFSEVKHGLNCLQYAYIKSNFREILSSLHPQLTEHVEQSFNTLFERAEKNIFILSISEHQNSEDHYGRLSMWRAYGGNVGVALVFNDLIVESIDDYDEEGMDSPGVLLPVYYFDKEKMLNHLNLIAQKMDDEKNIIKQMDFDHLKNMLINMLTWLVLATKHPGFEEEREWRLIFSPEFDEPLNLVKSEVIVKGVPQNIYKFSLDKIPNTKRGYYSFNEVFDRLIIGPTTFSLPIQRLFSETLIKLGVENPEEKIIVSEIPLRQ